MFWDMRLRACGTCAAPLVVPFPQSWTLDMIREGPETGPVEAFATPHRQGCPAPIETPAPGISVRVPGEYVSELSTSLGGGA